MEPECLLPSSRGPATGAYSVPNFIRSTSFQPTFVRSFLILYSHLLLCLPSVLFSSGFQTKILHVFLISPIRAICPAHLILLDLIILIVGEAYDLWVSSLRSFHQSPAIPSLLGPNILLSSLFSNNFNLCPSLTVRDQVHTNKINKWDYGSIYLNLLNF